MMRLVPVIKLARGLARNTTALATSSGVPMRPIGFLGSLADPAPQGRQSRDLDRAAGCPEAGAPERGHGLLDGILMTRADCDITAFRSQQRGDGAADSARPAGDDRLLALQPEIHLHPLSWQVAARRRDLLKIARAGMLSR